MDRRPPAPRIVATKLCPAPGVAGVARLVTVPSQGGPRQIRRTQSRDQALGELQDQTFERGLGHLRPFRPADARRAQARASHSRRDGRTGQRANAVEAAPPEAGARWADGSSPPSVALDATR